MSRRFGNARVPGCQCTTSYTCGPCLLNPPPPIHTPERNPMDTWPNYFENRHPAQKAEHLARNNDPDTSDEAAASLDLARTAKHDILIAWLDTNGCATDVEMAEFLVRTKVHATTEQARRSVRTLREEHGELVPAYDKDGERIRHRNPSGRWAECWKPGTAAPTTRKPDPLPTVNQHARRVAAYLREWEKGAGQDPDIITAFNMRPLLVSDLRALIEGAK